MVEIFKTNVEDQIQADRVIGLLNQRFPTYTVNFDLHDCDKILRIKGHSIPVTEIEHIVTGMGFDCAVLD